MCSQGRTAILDQIRQRPSNSRGKETLWHVDLPPQPFLDQVAGEVHGTGRLSYRISTIGYALRHATSVVSILLDSILLTRSVSCMTSVFRERMPWILDAVVQIQDLKGIADAVPLADVTAILQKCVACVSSVDEIMGGPALVQKGYLALVLLCRYIFMRRRGLVRRDAETAVQRRAVAATLIHLARASLQSKATASLVESHLSDLIAETVSENAIADDTDFVLCCQLLTDVALTLTPETPPRDKELPRLQDPELRRLAAQLVAPKEKAKPREGGNAKRQEAERPTGSSEISSRVLRRLRGLLRAGLHEPLETVFQLASCVALLFHTSPIRYVLTS